MPFFCFALLFTLRIYNFIGWKGWTRRESETSIPYIHAGIDMYILNTCIYTCMTMMHLLICRCPPSNRNSLLSLFFSEQLPRNRNCRGSRVEGLHWRIKCCCKFSWNAHKHKMVSWGWFKGRSSSYFSFCCYTKMGFLAQ